MSAFRPSKDVLGFLAMVAGLWGILFYFLSSSALLNIYLFQSQNPELAYADPSAPRMQLGDLITASLPAWLGLLAALLYLVYGCLSFRFPARLLGIATAFLDFAARVFFTLKLGAAMFLAPWTDLGRHAMVTVPFFLFGILSLVVLAVNFLKPKLPKPVQGGIS